MVKCQQHSSTRGALCQASHFTRALVSQMLRKREESNEVRSTNVWCPKGNHVAPAHPPYYPACFGGGTQADRSLYLLLVQLVKPLGRVILICWDVFQGEPPVASRRSEIKRENENHLLEVGREQPKQAGSRLSA